MASSPGALAASAERSRSATRISAVISLCSSALEELFEHQSLALMQIYLAIERIEDGRDRLLFVNRWKGNLQFPEKSAGECAFVLPPPDAI